MIPGLAIKTLRTLPLSLILIGALLSFGCENTAEDIDRLANITPEEAVDISKNVTVIYSDSARVKAQLTAPEMRVYHDSTGANEFTQGVLIIFYDEDTEEMQRITSKYAIQRADEGIVEFRDDVVITRNDGMIVKTNELIYLEEEDRYYGSQPITVESNHGRTTAQGTSFTSDGQFNNIIFHNGTALHHPESDAQFPSIGR
ncbi:MAG TPA: LPS export ABC transporter periplasmic protein LptC [Candidatus Sphingobacterium stercorigallinarum]|nr:LPS export ABC transporter periplasmic protein LptC [Candidatus Sphingobacterium stercorigallinarum]